MPTIDDKVVAMSFESSKFESGVSATLSALDKLKAALKFPGAGKGLEEVNASAKKINLGNVVSSLDEIKGRLNAFRLTAIAVFAEVASKALAAGVNFAKAFTLDPIKAGFKEYTTNLNAVQTILANTQASGAKLKDVNAALYELNKYSDKTIYNFAQMAKNIGTFTAAGVDLKTSTAAIKGIANLAALSGSNAEQAATAMYQLSQAISAGRVGLQDWNSVVNAGMGGAVFQRALAQTAEAMGVLEKGAVKLTGPMKNVSIHGKSFRESMMAKPGQVSWLTSDVLTNTLKQFTSDMSVAELKAQGFNDAQIKAIQATATTAMKAATEVKTISQVLDVAKEAAGSGWAQTWQIIFGNFGEAKTLFTGVSNAVNGFINASANARNKVLGDWKALGGRTVLIEAIKTTFEALGAILKPIKEAFRDIFPAKTGKDLYALTLQFRDFAETLKPSPETINNLKRTFRGLFALLDIGKQVLGGIFTVFGKLFAAIGGGSGSFLNFTGNIGDFLVALDKALKKGDGLQQFFAGLGTILAVPLKILGSLAHALATLFSGFSPEGFSVEMGSITKATKPFQQIIESIAQALQELGPAIGKSLAGINWETILAVVRTGLFAGLVLMLKKFIGGTTLPQLFGVFGKSVGKSFGKGIIGNISQSFGSLSGSLKTMQNELKARTLQEIAVAIALLAVSVLALSLVDPKKLSGALGAMTLMFGELIGAMALLDKVTSSKSFIKLPVIAASMILLAGAIDLLVIAVVAMSRLSWNELIKGLSGVAALLAGLSAASGPLSKNAGGMIRAGLGITAIALALKILAGVIADFGAMSWTELGKGLGAVAIGLIALTAAAVALPKGMVLKGAGLIAMATGLKILADAVAEFGSMDWKTLERGLAGVGGSLVVIAGAMQLMPKNMIITAAGLFLVAASLSKIVDAVGKMGGMSIEKLAKGLTSLAAALGILAIALHAMSGTMGGALALGAAATGIALLVPGLIALGKQSWAQIVKGMVALAAGLGLIAAAGMLLGPAVPALLGFGAALILVGGGLALAGAGIALIGVGLSAIAVAGPAAIGILVGALIQLSEAIPKMAKNLVLGLLEIVKALADTAPEFLKAMLVIIDSMLDAVIKSAPKIAQAFEALLLAGLKVLADNQDKIIQAGLSLLLALLKGINNNLGQLVTAVANIIVTFLNSLASQINRIVTAGFNFLISFLSGIANNITRVITAAGEIILAFVQGIGENISKIVTAGLTIVVNLVTGIANNVGKIITAGTNAVVNFITGVGNASAKIVTAGTEAIIKFINALGSNSVKLADAGAKAIIDFLNGVADVIKKREPEMIAAGARIGVAIVQGLINGIASMFDSVVSKAKELGDAVIKALGKAVKFWSPSHEAFKIGQGIVDGLALGLDENKRALKSTTELGNQVVKILADTISDSLDINPVITPILDLTRVQSQSLGLASMISAPPITAAVSLGQASAISSEQARALTEAGTNPIGQTAIVKFEQNNYSPEALPAIEIYRQTRNQLSLLKSALALT